MPTYPRGPEPTSQEPGNVAPSHLKPGEGTTTPQHPVSDRVHISRERRRLFTAVADIFIGATDEIQPAEIGKLIAVINLQQLAASL